MPVNWTHNAFIINILPYIDFLINLHDPIMWDYGVFNYVFFDEHTFEKPDQRQHSQENIDIFESIRKVWVLTSYYKETVKLQDFKFE